MSHKRQHYVPRSYLKAWLDPACPPKQTPYVWIFEKDQRTGRRKSPEKILRETDMYTIRTTYFLLENDEWKTSLLYVYEDSF